MIILMLGIQPQANHRVTFGSLCLAIRGINELAGVSLEIPGG